MKNIVLLSAWLFFSTAAIAQAPIILYSNELPQIGQEIEQGTDTLPGPQIQPGATGGGNWDFSGLEDHLSAMLRIRPVSEAPLYQQFPGATAAVEFEQQGYQMIKVSPQNLQFLGLSGFFPINDSTQVPLAVRNNPPQTILQFPASFGQQFTETVRSVLQLPMGFPFDSIRVATRNVRTVHVDGYGIVTTPAGQFATLRVREQALSLDTTFGLTPIGWLVLDAQSVPDTSVNFVWWGKMNNRAFPVAELVMSPGIQGAHVVSATYLKNISTSPAKEAVREMFSLNLYPNPAATEAYFEVPHGVSGVLQVFDFQGRMVAERTVRDGLQRLDIGGLKPGYYAVTVKDRTGRLLGATRFEVMRR